VAIRCSVPRLLVERSVAECVAPLVASGYRAQTIDHSPDAHRRAASSLLAASDLLRPFDASAPAGAWPHFLLSAADVPEPA